VSREVNLVTGAGDLVAVFVQFEVGYAQHTLAGLVRRRAAQHRVHAREQFLDAERLDDVVVGSGAQPADAVVRGVPRRQEDDRDLGTRRPEVLQHAEAVHARHHHVKDNEIRIRLRDSGEGGLAIVGGHCLEAVETQRRRHQVGDVLLVVNDQDASLGPRWRLVMGTPLHWIGCVQPE
jgi:hypothetical protein